MKKVNIFICGILLFACSTIKEESMSIQEPELAWGLNRTETVQYKSLSGVDPNLLSMDIYYSRRTFRKKPVVIYVHGGAWSIGDKANSINDKVNLFRGLGYVFVSINYRLSPFPFQPYNPNRIKFPDHNNDIADAIKWIHSKISLYGGNKNKMALIGHSAGAHLVALTSSNQSFLNQKGLPISIIKGVAVIDTEGYDIHEQVHNGANQNMYINAFGLNPNLHQAASPLFHLDSHLNYPKFFVAKRGSSSRIQIANNFISALTMNNIDVSEIDASIYDHAGINEAIGKAGETLMTNAIINFFSSCFQ